MSASHARSRCGSTSPLSPGALAEAAQRGTTPSSPDSGQTAGKIAECDRKLAQYRAALDAGANPATVAAWIDETEAQKASCALVMRRPNRDRA